MADEADANVNTYLVLGEIRGQLRELIHNSNNNAQKLDALAIRVGALEKAQAASDGATSAWKAILHSPALGWLFGAASMIYLFITGRLSP